MTNITNPIFTVTSADNEAYIVTCNLQGISPGGSTHSILFRRDPSKAPSDITTIDIASVNSHDYGTQAKNVKRLFEETFKKPAVKGDITSKAHDIIASATIAGINVNDSSSLLDHQVVAVFDLKDTSTKYVGQESSESIRFAEQTIYSSFLPKAESRNADHKKVQDLFSQIHPTIICEGSIKNKLLSKGNFSLEEIDFLQKSTDAGGGSEILCQLTEFLMTAEKIGYTVFLNPTGSPVQLEVGQYFKSLDPAYPYQPCKESIVVLPPSYQEMAKTGPYTSAMKCNKVFQYHLLSVDSNPRYTLTTTRLNNQLQLSSSSDEATPSSPTLSLKGETEETESSNRTPPPSDESLRESPPIAPSDEPKPIITTPTAEAAKDN